MNTWLAVGGGFILGLVVALIFREWNNSQDRVIIAGQSRTIERQANTVSNLLVVIRNWEEVAEAQSDTIQELELKITQQELYINAFNTHFRRASEEEKGGDDTNVER